MSIALDPTERRLVGSLIEKQLSVPESYPLTLNALVAACNQKSNRDPETNLPEYMVSGALRALMEKQWVIHWEREGSRVPRYTHRAQDQLGVDEHDLAILAELLLRGPQSPPELRTRASRMRPFASLEEVERRLDALAKRPVPYVRCLGRRPGERVARWEHLLGGGDLEGRAAAPESRPAATAAPEAPAALPSPAPLAALPADPVAELLDRVERLECEVASLREEMGRLHGGAAD